MYIQIFYVWWQDKREHNVLLESRPTDTQAHTHKQIVQQCMHEDGHQAQQMNNLIDLRYRFVRNWLQQGQHFCTEKMQYYFMHYFSYSMCVLSLSLAHLRRQTVMLMLFNVYCKYARIQSKAILGAHENGRTRRIEGKKESKREQVCNGARDNERRRKKNQQQINIDVLEEIEGEMS